MKTFKLLNIFFFVLVIESGLCQNNFSFNVNKYYYLCKTWGFLKYYIPDKHINWDDELLLALNSVSKIENKDSFNHYIINWIDRHAIEKNKINEDFPDDSLLITDFSWFLDTNFINKTLSKKLNFILYHFKPRNNKLTFGKAYYAVDFSKDNLYYSSSKITKNERILGLFRLWNIIEYFYPYKLKINGNWNDILKQAIPLIISSDSEEEYNLIIASIIAKLNDSHAFLNSPFFVNKYNLTSFIPFSVRYINNNIIVSHKICKCPNVNIGDTIIKANNQTFSDYYKTISKYFSASNKAYQYTHLSNIFINDIDSKTQSIVLKNNGIDRKITFNKISFDSLKRCSESNHYNPILINDSINFLDVQNISKKNLKKVFYKNDPKYVIIDLRSYPQNSNIFILNYLNRILSKQNIKYYYKEIAPSHKYPGYYKLFKNGKKTLNKNKKLKFKGVIIGIISEETKSLSECIALELKSYEHSVLIGTNTAGATGGVTYIYLPGNISIPITILKSKFNSIDYQGDGITPDIIKYKNYLFPDDIFTIINLYNTNVVSNLR